MSAQSVSNLPVEPTEEEENIFHELSEDELREVLDRNARELLGIGGEEFLRRLRNDDPILNDIGQPVPGWVPVAMIGDLLIR